MATSVAFLPQASSMARHGGESHFLIIVLDDSCNCVASCLKQGTEAVPDHFFPQSS